MFVFQFKRVKNDYHIHLFHIEVNKIFDVYLSITVIIVFILLGKLHPDFVYAGL